MERKSAGGCRSRTRFVFRLPDAAGGLPQLWRDHNTSPLGLDISWFMKALSEPIAFWQGPFRAKRIIDEAGLLACCMHVDLNPIRAAMAESLDKSQYTSAFDLIGCMKWR